MAAVVCWQRVCRCFVCMVALLPAWCLLHDRLFWGSSMAQTMPPHPAVHYNPYRPLCNACNSKYALRMCAFPLCRVCLLEDMLLPGTIVDEGEQPDVALLANATKLADRYRLVVAVLPDIDADMQEQAPQTRTGTAPGAPRAAAARAAGGPSSTAAGRVGGASQGPGSAATSGTGSEDAALLSKQHRQPCTPRIEPFDMFHSKNILAAGSKEGRILVGTMSQVLQLLQHMVGTPRTTAPPTQVS